MPHIQVNATCPIDREQEQQLITQIGDAISLLPGMKAEYLMIRLEDDCRLFFCCLLLFFHSSLCLSLETL